MAGGFKVTPKRELKSPHQHYPEYLWNLLHVILILTATVCRRNFQRIVFASSKLFHANWAEGDENLNS